jgi:hypothetical protein
MEKVDGAAIQTDQPKPEATGPKVQAQLVITLYDDGSCPVIGPFENPLLCYGMLGLAQAALVMHQDDMRKANAPRIEVPKVPFMKRVFMPGARS